MYFTFSVDGDSIDAPVLCLQLLEENTHCVAQGFEGELAEFSSGRQTYGDHRQAVLIHHCNVCGHIAIEMAIKCIVAKSHRPLMHALLKTPLAILCSLDDFELKKKEKEKPRNFLKLLKDF